MPSGLTAWGDYGHGGVPLLRHKSYALQNNAKINDNQDFCTAKEGDCVFVIGEIGLARTGLFTLEKTINQHEVHEIIKQYPVACNAHLNPIPLVAEGLFLSRFAILHPIFLMDISDGLMRDLPRLLARQGILTEKDTPLGAQLHITEKDLHREVLDYAKTMAQNPINFAYSGGEDYGLLGICSKETWEHLQEAWKEKSQFSRLWKIGEVCQKNITLNNIITKENGFDHFQK